MHELFLEEKYNRSGDARIIIEALERRGYDAYFVGGVVRDSILGIENQDYDICTSARPDTILEILNTYGFHCLDHSIDHNLIVVINDDEKQFDVSTFKGKDIKEDLGYRDYTINAMAYSPKTGLIDPYNGLSDLSESILRATGSPEERFKEDPIRILRGIRFSAQYDLTIEPETNLCIYQVAKSIINEPFSEYKDRIAQERIGKELIKLFETGNAANIIENSKEVLFAMIPELAKMYEYNQDNPHHANDLFTHTLLVLFGTENNTMKFGPKRTAIAFMFATLFHDIGKVKTKTEKNGVSHYYGHENVSAEIAEEIMKRIGINKHIRKATNTIIKLHGYPLEPKLSSVLRMLNKIDDNAKGMAPDIFIDLCVFKLLDSASNLTPEEFKEAALNFDYLDKITDFHYREIVGVYINECMFSSIPYAIRMLPINGSDLMLMTGRNAGPWIGKTLKTTLKHVINGSIGYDKESVLNEALKLSKNFED